MHAPNLSIFVATFLLISQIQKFGGLASIRQSRQAYVKAGRPTSKQAGLRQSRQAYVKAGRPTSKQAGLRESRQAR
jgi:hypothetical protein